MTEHTYDWWRNAQAGHKVGGPQCPVHDGVAHPGFYRMRRGRNAPWMPVAIFVHEGELIALVNDSREEDPAELWTWVAKNHVSEAAYRAARETGKWPDIDDTITAPPPMGHNAPLDEADEIKDQIESAKAGLSAYETIESDEACARAQSLRSRLLELSRGADKRRVAEKEPHLDASKAIDARWQPLVKAAKAAADTIAAALSKYLTNKARAEEEERRKAEAAARKAAEAGKPAPEAPAPAPQPTQIKGGHGRAANVKVVRVVVDVTDWDALWGFMKEHPEVRDLLTKLAQRAIDKGHTVPGVTVEEQRKVA